MTTMNELAIEQARALTEQLSGPMPIVPLRTDGVRRLGLSGVKYLAISPVPSPTDAKLTKRRSRERWTLTAYTVGPSSMMQPS